MKRNLSINISGLVFNVEEEAYEQLRAYLKSINQYFAKDEDSVEIIADIEARIAEIFYEKLNAQKQVINITDVEDLMANMGSIDDFQAVEEDPAYEMTFEEEPSLEIPTESDFDPNSGALVKAEEIDKKTYQGETEFAQASTSERQEYSQQIEDFIAQYEPVKESFSKAKQTARTEERPQKEKGYRRLFRDTKRQVIGGVAAGLAQYIGIDALWLRLGFLMLSFGFYFIPAVPSAMVILYLAVWIAAPANDSLEEVPVQRRLFRDPERGVLGGVCTGIAAFFGIPEIFVRLLFLGSMALYGTGLMLYFMLWVLIPPIRGMSDRLQMSGKAFNLSNIKAFSQIDENQRDASLSTLHKVILFPFQIIALSIRKTNKVLRPLVNFVAEAIRIIGGFSLFLLSLTLLFAITLPFILFLGWEFNALNDTNIPTEVWLQSFDLSPFTLFSFYFTALIPTLLIGFFGVMILRRQLIWHGLFGWTTLGLWFISLIFSVASGLIIAKEFAVRSYNQEELPYQAKIQKPLNIKVNIMSDMMAPQAHFHKLTGYEGEKVKLVKRYYASGHNESKARMNAKMIGHKSYFKNAELIIDEKTPFTSEAKFRDQSVVLELLIPYGQKFTIDKSLKQIGFHFLQNYNIADLEGKELMFSKTEGLVCEDCPEQTQVQDSNLEYEEVLQNPVTLFNGEFDELELKGAMVLTIKQDENEEPKIWIENGHQNNIRIEQSGKTIELKNKAGLENDLPRLLINVATLKELKVLGASVVKLSNLQQKRLEMKLTGASKLEGQGVFEKLEIEMSGASRFLGFEIESEEIELKGSGATLAQVNAKHSLSVDIDGASRVRYQKKPQSIDKKNINGAASLRQD